jgi:hypothetical protein
VPLNGGKSPSPCQHVAANLYSRNSLT